MRGEAVVDVVDEGVVLCRGDVACGVVGEVFLGQGHVCRVLQRPLGHTTELVI